MQGLAEGRFDIAMTGFDNVVAYQEGQGEAKIPDNPDLFAFMGSDNGFLSMLAGKGVKSFAELKGKKLSVDALTTGFAFVLRELLAKNGVSESDVGFERAGGVVERFQELMKGTHAATLVLTPFDLIGMARGHAQLARAGAELGAYLGIVGAARRSWARDNQEALLGFIRAYRDGVAFLFENRDIAEALLVANIRAMTPALAREALKVFLDPESGFYRDVRLDPAGAATVLALRSKYAGRKLEDPSRYMDGSYRSRALAR
jgi:ABC-type nitrate/sulfonate/bicarbonate transport system substrate-binding protein